MEARQAEAEAAVAAANAAAAGAAEAAANAGVVYAARNPNEAILGPFDYADKAHLAIYRDNTESLYAYDKNADRFDLEPDRLQGFMALLEARVVRCGWQALLTYTVNGVPTQFMDHYGEIPEAVIRTKSTVYLIQRGRSSQDSEQLYQCLIRSVTTNAYQRLINSKEQFNVAILIGGVLVQQTDGPLLLAAIVSQSYTNTRSMGAIYRTNLTKLDEKMRLIPGSDITVFNAYVKSQINLLAAGGGTCDDLPYYLIKAYKCTGDYEFSSYIRQKELAWKDGLLTWNRNGTDLMSIADNYYRDAKATGIWLEASPEQNRIIALEAQLKVAMLTARERERRPRTPKSRSGNPDKAVREFRDEDKWKLVSPGQGAKTKVHNKKTYHWCEQHKMWTIHTQAECRLAKAPAQQPVALSTVIDEDLSMSDGSSVDSFPDDDSAGSNIA